MTKQQALYNSLKQALDRLKEAASQTPTVFNQDSTIKRFEFTFELAWKLMREVARYEGFNMPSPRSSIRQAADLGLIDDPKKWFVFLKARNLTVHTYKEEIAQKVYKKAKEFIVYVERLLEKAKSYTK